ncbi:acyl carrier protein [Paenibacillus silvisoli]|uniref:acyl carrier protein n=1 Tax=Paenibacillus silvisoli TaxID=3110539 RepID=UPI002804512B|nr:phosphopantetheine-binding protein [Paenibacillus silvisoli]
MHSKFVEDKVLFLLQEALSEDVKNVGSNDDLINLGLDSIKSVSLIVALESTFDITFEDGELLFENFSSINKIVEIVTGKLVPAT